MCIQGFLLALGTLNSSHMHVLRQHFVREQEKIGDPVNIVSDTATTVHSIFQFLNTRLRYIENEVNYMLKLKG
jgi:hypothetical protein